MGPHGRSDSEKTADEGGAASWRREEAPRDGKRAILGDGAAHAQSGVQRSRRRVRCAKCDGPRFRWQGPSHPLWSLLFLSYSR